MSRDSAKILDNITLHIKSGDFVGVLGSNGAGKTSLLRVLAGVHTPTKGIFTSKGKTGLLLDAGYGLDTVQSGFANIKTYGILNGLAASEIESLQEEVANISGLGPALRDPIRTYSSGMLTRLTFGMATSITPDVLIIDEGLATGDAEFQGLARKRMDEFLMRSSIVVMASHDMGLLRDLCTRGIVLRRGKLIADLPIEQAVDLYLRDAKL